MRDTIRHDFKLSGKNADFFKLFGMAPKRGGLVCVVRDILSRILAAHALHVTADSRQVVLGQREDLATSTVHVDGLNWLIDRPQSTFRCEARFRYQQQSRPCEVELLDNNEAVITPDEPILGVAPGQAAVMYEGDRVLGGGWIRN